MLEDENGRESFVTPTKIAELVCSLPNCEVIILNCCNGREAASVIRAYNERQYSNNILFWESKLTEDEAASVFIQYFLSLVKEHYEDVPINYEDIFFETCRKFTAAQYRIGAPDLKLDPSVNFHGIPKLWTIDREVGADDDLVSTLETKMDALGVDDKENKQRM